MRRLKGKILIVSDLHLADGSGADNFGHGKMIRFISMLKNLDPDYIIFNGDFLELWQTHFEYIWIKYHDLFEELRTRNVICILGNHDYNIDKDILFPFQIYKQLDFIHDNLIYHCEHGHKYDIFKKRWWKLFIPFVKLFGWIERIILRVPGRELRLLKMQTRLPDNDRYIKAADNILKDGYYDICIFGHTHKFIQKDYNTGQKYFNTGCWIGDRTDFIFLREKKNEQKKN